MTDKARIIKIRSLIKLLRTTGLYHSKAVGKNNVCVASIRYENDARELCDDVEGLLSEVEREREGRPKD